MIQLGNYNTLEILRETSVGMFLGDDDVDDLLLPTKYIPEQAEVGDSIEVFCYLDHEERPIATTLKPYIKRNDFGFLRVAEVNEIGAFLDWGLEKHLLVPFREQTERMKEGHWYVVYCYLDEQSFRLVASAKFKKFLKNDKLTLAPKDEVDLLISRSTNLGFEVIVNNQHLGLVYHDEIYQPIQIGDRIKGFVKKIRSDKKLDIALKPIGHLNIEPSADKVYSSLVEAGGFMALHDKSTPEDIQAIMNMSKKTFKKAIGTLYKARKIDIQPNGIHLVIKED